MVIVALGHFQHGVITDELMSAPSQPSEPSGGRPRRIPLPRRLVFQLDHLLLSAIGGVLSLNQALVSRQGWGGAGRGEGGWGRKDLRQRPFLCFQRRNIGVKFVEFDVFGKDWMQQNKIHPDSFVQCALQLSFYQLHKR